jgi:hypothetical protein
MVNAQGMKQEGGTDSYTFASEPRPVASRKKPKVRLDAPPPLRASPSGARDNIG